MKVLIHEDPTLHNYPLAGEFRKIIELNGYDCDIEPDILKAHVSLKKEFYEAVVIHHSSDEHCAFLRFARPEIRFIGYSGYVYSFDATDRYNAKFHSIYDDVVYKPSGLDQILRNQENNDMS